MGYVDELPKEQEAGFTGEVLKKQQMEQKFADTGREFLRAAKMYVETSGQVPTGGNRHKARSLLMTKWFDAAMGLVVVANSVTIGMEQAYRLNGDVPVEFAFAEVVFMAVYIGELGMRFFAYGVSALRDNWVKFDLGLVSVAIIADWIIPLSTSSLEAGHSGQEVTMVLILRMARLARLARAIRLLVKFRQLYLLVHSFLSSMLTMFYTVLLILIVLYVFSCAGMELITFKIQEEGESTIPEDVRFVLDTYFSSPGRIMLTLVQFVCLDGLSSIYRPLIEYDWQLVFYFMTVILVIGVVLMNIITAILVNSAVEQGSSDKEALRMIEERWKAALMDELQALFGRIDADGSGFVTWQELSCVGAEDQALLSEFCAFANPKEVFRILDTDESGVLEIDEFCEGLFQCVTGKSPIELRRMDKQLKKILAKQEQFEVKICQVLSEVLQQQQVFSEVTTILAPSCPGGLPLGSARAETVDQSEAPLRCQVQALVNLQQFNLDGCAAERAIAAAATATETAVALTKAEQEPSMRSAHQLKSMDEEIHHRPPRVSPERMAALTASAPSTFASAGCYVVSVDEASCRPPSFNICGAGDASDAR